MIQPLPLFALREWGTRFDANQACPHGDGGRLEPAEICPHCLGTGTAEIGTRTEGDRVLTLHHCGGCGYAFETEGRTRLACSECGSAFESGWHRHYYASEQPTFLHGKLDVRRGNLFATVQHFIGRPTDEDPYHLADFVIDIDRGDDLDAAIDAAATTADYFDSVGAYYHLYFSGAKGFHLIVPWQVLGAEPSTQLNNVTYKHLSRQLAEDLGVEYDPAIYSRRRMLRVENTQHGKTGLYKVQLARSELRRLTVLELAKTPRAVPPFSGSGTVQEIKKAPPLAKRYQAALEYVPPKPQVAKLTSTFSAVTHPPCVNQALAEGPPGPGTRHQLTVNLAAYWASTGGDTDEFLEWARDVPGGSDTPESERVREAANALRWAQRNRPPFRCQTMQDLGLCDPKCPFYQGFG